MGQIGCEVWLINMCGTCQFNRTGASPGAKLANKELKIVTYKSMFQHRSKCLTYALWMDSNVVKTLSNSHKPIILAAGKGILQR
jgi:hypothetical protein